MLYTLIRSNPNMQFVTGICFLLIPVTAVLGELQATISTDGQYDISVDGKTWLRSGPMFVNKDGRTWTVGNSSTDLQLTGARFNTHTDPAGSNSYNENEFTYNFGNTSDSVIMSVLVYTGRYSQRIVFQQTYVSGAANTSVGGAASFNKTISGFPCFLVQNGDEDLGFLSYGGYMFGNTEMTTGQFTNTTDNINDGMQGGPLAVFNKRGKTVVISPFDNFMAASQWHDGKPGGHIGWGIMGGVNYIPANFTCRTILVYDDTINDAIFRLGGHLWTRGETFDNIHRMFERTRNQTQDVSLNYLGYWTDNGAYYYYQPEKNKTFEDTLIDVNKYANSANIPYRYMQLDSWWYPKDKDYKAVLEWTPKQNIFPHGLKNLSDTLGLKFVAHNRYWSKDTPYAKQNNGSYDWVIGRVGSLPNDIDFWRHLMQDGKNWGLAVYEQDWLNVQTEYLAALQTSLTLGRDWLTQMGQAAAENNITIQYCMALPRHALQSTEIPSVTQARVSDDFLYKRPDQWKIGVTSIFARAMKLRVFKDTFWTTKDQPGNPFNKTSLYPELESAVSSLSGGPVGPGDMISGTNVSLLMRCCSTDGRIIKPSRPARATDLQLITDAFSTDGTKVGEVWMTQSFIPTMNVQKEYGLLFAADISRPFNVSIADLHFNVLREGVYFPYNDVTSWKTFNENTTIALDECSKAKFCLYYFSPFIMSEVETVILGEVTKWIPMSQDRILNILTLDRQIKLDLQGTDGETVPIWYIQGNQLKHMTCQIRGQKSTCDLFGPPQTTARTTSTGNTTILTTTTTSGVAACYHGLAFKTGLFLLIGYFMGIMCP